VVDRLSDRRKNIECGVPGAKAAVGETPADFIGVQERRHDHGRARSQYDFALGQEPQAPRHNGKPIVGRGFKQEGNRQIVLVRGQVIKNADRGIAAGDETVRGLAETGARERRHFIPRHASM